MIKTDSVNKKVWDEILATVKTQGSVSILCVISTCTCTCMCMCLCNVELRVSWQSRTVL